MTAPTQSSGAPSTGSAAPSSSSSQPSTDAGPTLSTYEGSTVAASAADDDDEGEDDDDEEEGDEASAAASGTANSKQRKKKKSKAAAKLRKKLGLGSSSSATPQLSDQMVSQIQQNVEAEHGAQAAAKVDRASLAKVMAALNMERDAMHKSQESKQKGQKAIADHKFWKTQPVAKPEDALPHVEEGPIQPNQPPSEVRQEPYPLPKDFEWVTIDIDDDEELKEVYELLSANYVEDDEASLRFKYSPEFLRWVLKHPGYRKTWHVGVRVSSSRKLVAFISGIPHELRVREQAFHSTEINFLCVHKKLRSKRLTPVLIQEVTRQCNLTGVFQAIYTAGIVIPTPMACARYYHRTINAPKLLDIGFAQVPQGMSRARYEASFALPDETRLGAREMEEKDVQGVGKLMRRYMRRFDMAPRFNDEEVRHVMLSGRGKDVGGKRVGQVTWTYVIERDGVITDVFSFYSLPSSVLTSDKHKTLNAAYLFYYATDVPFQHSKAPTSSGSSLVKAAEAAGKAHNVPEWQRSTITGLTLEQVLDEEDVTKWDLESPSVKSALKKRLNELVKDLLIIAKTNGFDVVNCLTVMDNQLFLQEQKFGPGDGFLRFYLFNWRVQPVCGGMGNRAGEPDFDPVVAQIKASLKHAKGSSSSNSSNGGGGKASADEQLRLLLEDRPRAEMGSGLGVVMV